LGLRRRQWACPRDEGRGLPAFEPAGGRATEVVWIGLLTLTYAILPASFFVTIALQLATTGFTGALWFWGLNLVITAAFAVAMLVARRRGDKG
jgi:hypothetical protein